MANLGKIRVLYIDDGKKKTVNGAGDDMGSYIKVELNPSKRRTKFKTVLVPWHTVIKVVIMG